MVIKYKAKFIKDGEVVIDDTALIELGSVNTNAESTTGSSHLKSNNAWESLIADSEERLKSTDRDEGYAPNNATADGSPAIEHTHDASTAVESPHDGNTINNSTTGNSVMDSHKPSEKQ